MRKEQKVAILLALASQLYASDAILLEGVSASTHSFREDLDLSSPTNLYRVEQSAQFGTQVLTKEDIDAYQPKDFYDLIDKAIGIDVTYQGRKSPFFINMRGGGSVTYIIDGAILPSTANRILLKLPMSAIEEIQIVRGSTALALAPSIGIGASNSGSGLNTGFIIIRTKRPKDTEGLISAFVEKSSNNPTANGQDIFLGTKLGDGSVDGYIGALVSRSDRPSSDKRFDGSDSKAVMLTAGLNVDRFSINAMGYKDKGYFELQRGITVQKTLDDSKWYYDPIETTVLSSDLAMQWNENHTTLASIFQVEYEHSEYSNEKFGQSLAPIEKRYKEKSNGYSLRHNMTFDNTLIQLGGQYTHSDGFGANLNSAYNRFDTNILGGSASIEQSLFDGDLVLDAGYRYDKKHINYSSTNANKNSANNSVDMAPAKVMAFGALYKITPMFLLSGRYFQGDEGSSGDFDLLTKDGSSLHSEKQKRSEIALEAKIKPYFQPTITWFNVDFTNQKSATTDTYTDTKGSEYYYYTESDSLRRGLEFAIKGSHSGFNYLLALTHMTKNETKNKNGVSNSIGSSTAKNSFTGKIGYTWENYRANLSVKKIGSYDTSTSAMGTAYDVHLGDYTSVDANIAGDFKYSNSIYSAKLYGRNIGNTKYATRYTTGYYYDRGRTIGLELSMAF
ncbi:MAG: TonB-dependent receptor plug domain-containing protein [Sulfuricurvum sp.]